MNRKRTMTTSKNADDDGDEAKLKQFNSYNKPRRRREDPTLNVVPQRQQRNCDNQTAKN
jgi:hypothetical protein